MEQAPQTNRPATEVETAIADALKAAADVVIKTAEDSLDTSMPFFSLPVVKDISDFFIEEMVSAMTDKMSIYLQKIGSFIVMDTQIDAEQKGISKALSDLIIAEKSGDPVKIKQAIAEYQIAQSALINYNGSDKITL